MRITFEGVRGSGYQGDIAIDDISFETCNGKRSYLFMAKHYLLVFYIKTFVF